MNSRPNLNMTILDATFQEFITEVQEYLNEVKAFCILLIDLS